MQKGKLPAGMVYREMVMGFDCHATALAAAGLDISRRALAPVPPAATSPNEPDASAFRLMLLDGVNLLPFLPGEKQGCPHEQLFWRAGAKHAARVGDWKLVQERGGGAELFNLKDDISEKTDLAEREPAKLKELQAAYDAWDRQMMPAQWVRQDGRSQLGGRAKVAPARGGGIEERFKQYDRNADGKLTPDEFPRVGVFRQMDTDNDGVLTLDEVRAYYSGRRQKAKQVEGR